MADLPGMRNDLVLSRASSFLWGIPIALGILAMSWPAGRPYLLTTAFLWAGLGCVVNAGRCGRFHCHLTGPLYLVLGVMSALIGLGVLDLAWSWIAAVFALGTFIAYIPEFFGWKYVRRQS